jgi:hypothetical protein
MYICVKTRNMGVFISSWIVASRDRSPKTEMSRCQTDAPYNRVLIFFRPNGPAKQDTDTYKIEGKIKNKSKSRRYKDVGAWWPKRQAKEKNMMDDVVSKWFRDRAKIRQWSRSLARRAEGLWTVTCPPNKMRAGYVENGTYKIRWKKKDYILSQKK